MLDLNPNNVFLCPDSQANSCIIDWQHTVVLPLLLVAGHPKLFENPDPYPPKGLAEPELPADYESLSVEEGSQADELHRRRVLYQLYRVFNGGLNKQHLEALRDPLLILRHYLVDRAGRQWNGDLVILKGALIRIMENWHQIQTYSSKEAECPVKFSESEIEENY